MTTAFKTKDPQGRLDYIFDWASLTNDTGGESNWLATDETIISYTLAPQTGITIDSDELINDNTAVLMWLSGGTAETIYTVTCHITTSAGRQDDRSMYVTVAQR